MLSHILLNCSIWDNLPTALALCLLPFLLGWLAARAYYKVGWLRDQVAELTERVSSLEEQLTNCRLKLAQAEADSEAKSGQIHKLKDDLMMCESERNALREQAGKGGGASTKTAIAAPTAPASIMFGDKKYKWDDLKIVEGIGPKIEEILHSAGIKTWKALSGTSTDRLRTILDAAGPSFQIHDPATWPKQAGLADQGKWDDLKKWQDELDAGKA